MFRRAISNTLYNRREIAQEPHNPTGVSVCADRPSSFKMVFLFRMHNLNARNNDGRLFARLSPGLGQQLCFK